MSERIGQVVLLNGASSAGKSTSAGLLQRRLPGPCLHSGIHHFLQRLPDSFSLVADREPDHDHFGVLWLTASSDDPDGRVPLRDHRWRTFGRRLVRGMYSAARALSGAGVDVILDDVVLDRSVAQEAEEALSDTPVLSVGVRCAIDVLERREAKRGDRFPGLARVLHQRVHQTLEYDLEVDTSSSTAAHCTAVIADELSSSTPSLGVRLGEETDHATTA